MENENESKLHLTDLIDTQILQQIQDAFSEMTDMAGLTTDCNGIPLTQGSNFTDFCMKYTRPSELGGKRCEHCDINGAEISRKYGTACAYSCHAGLVDFAAPIVANGEIVGSFIGGQVLVDPPDLHRIRETAVELGIDPDEYIEALKKVPVVSKSKVEKAAHFLYVIASTLSSIAYKSYELHQSNLEIEKASHMKSDFLANMSHEIRTPMNAVIGLADLALREEMPSAAREYVHQIKASGKNLLVIINDILDFSKIESGKMDIVEVEYEPLSIIQDLTSIVNSRIGDKDIEFTMDIPPDLPKNLYGDNVRIHQIILNLLTNAVKFTKQGEVHFRMSYEKPDGDTILMKAEIRDTGIGIKKEDMNKIFNSFQQVDSKRNRNIEGTGLGLAITRQLLALMGGRVTVESEYNKGTSFFFEVPQKVVDATPVMPRLESPVKTAVLVENRYVKEQLIRDLERIGTEYTDLADNSSYDNLDLDFFIVEKSYFSETVRDFVISRPDMQCLMLVDYDSIDVIDIPNVRAISKPAYSLSLYNAMGIHDLGPDGGGTSESDGFSFVAPDAHILVVDDNSVNLTVATGLLEPLEMKIDTAQSAAEAIEKIHHVKYDVIFMDHMMPEVDGVEATHIIRRLVPSYNDVPIIALTANAIGGAKEMFIREGMNDFLAKPIDIKDALSKLRRWLPQEKIIPVDKNSSAAVSAQKHAEEPQGGSSVMDIKELNVANALTLLGSEKLFRTVLKEYYSAIDKKSQVILDHKAAGDWRNYAIEVHSLKSTSRQIGADSIADVAAELEKAGNEQNAALINEKTDGMIKEYRRLKNSLKKYFPEEEDEQRTAEFEDIVVLLAQMHSALDNFDTLQVDEEIEVMSKFRYAGKDADFFERLRSAAADGDIGECINIVDEWGKKLIDPENAGEKALGLLDELQDALDNFDILGIDDAVEKMSSHIFPNDQMDFIPRLREAAERSDIEQCAGIVSEWRTLIGNNA